KNENSGNDLHASSASATTATDDSVDSLRKELERLKLRLEEERKKLNDVSCTLTKLFTVLEMNVHFFSPHFSRSSFSLHRQPFGKHCKSPYQTTKTSRGSRMERALMQLAQRL